MIALGTPACVGLDPVVEKLPPEIRQATSHATPLEGIERFCLGVIEAIAPRVPVVKVQAACFERYGSPGWACMERVIATARRAGLFVLLDAKRGDISTSAEHYAQAAVAMGAHGITVNPYLGPSGIAPFLHAGLVVFALVRTSNPDSDGLQQARLATGETVAEHVASMVHDLGLSYTGRHGLPALGAVVGATKIESAVQLRQKLPNAIFLTPGIGAQGASVADTRSLCRAGHQGNPGRAGLLPTASRSVLYPDGGGPSDWRQMIAKAAGEFADQAYEAIG
jgi:orotidine-5'-phosphate decarboxylase